MGQPLVAPTPPGTNLTGKTIIITGGNVGLGFETARQMLVLKAARVIITVRSAAKGKEATQLLASDANVRARNPAGKVEYMELNLEDYRSGLAFIERVKKDVPELDVLLLNGGTMLMTFEKSASGHEKVVQVNAYTNFLIAFGLMPLLQATARKRGSPTHLTFTGSNMHKKHTLKKTPLSSPSVISHFDDKSLFDSLARYNDSKLLVRAFVQELSRRVPSSEVVINDPCPGMVRTTFDRNLPVYLRPVSWLMFRFQARSVEEGARTLVYATVVAGRETHGRFMQSNAVDEGAEFLEGKDGEAFREKLWREVIEECAAFDSGARSFA